MKILMFHPANFSAKDIESLAGEIIRDGHKFILVTLSGHGALHDNIKKLGGDVYCNLKRDNIFSSILSLVKLINELNVDIVYSNLQQCSIISIFAQYFVRSKIFSYRHHSDSVALFGSKKEKIADFLINMFSRKVIVISKICYKQVVEAEKTKSNKVVLIPLGYNFDLFPLPNHDNVVNIRNNNDCSFLIVIVGRLIALKRVEIAIDVVSELRKNSGLDVKLIILGDGEEYQNLKKKISDSDAGTFINIIGHVDNVLDYISASDVLIHTSCSEASCHMPKESGFLSKTVVVCDGVGDFSDYIIHKKNGLLMSRDNTRNELMKNLIFLYNSKEELELLGSNLNKTVTDTFDIKKIKNLHYNLWQNG